MPITGSVFARAPAHGRASLPTAPTRGDLPSPVGPVQPIPPLSVQSATSRAGLPLPLLDARVSTVSNDPSEVRQRPSIVRGMVLHLRMSAISGA